MKISKKPFNSDIAVTYNLSDELQKDSLLAEQMLYITLTYSYNKEFRRFELRNPVEIVRHHIAADGFKNSSIKHFNITQEQCFGTFAEREVDAISLVQQLLPDLCFKKKLSQRLN